MTHCHDVTLTEIDYICNKLFSNNDQSDTYIKLRGCIIHKNYKRNTYDFNTGSCMRMIMRVNTKMLSINCRKYSEDPQVPPIGSYQSDFI